LLYHTREGLLSADAVFVDSQHARNELLRFAGRTNMNFIKNRTHIIPAGVDISSFVLPDTIPEKSFNSLIRNVESSVDHQKGRSKKQSIQILTENFENNEADIGKLLNKIRSVYDYRYPDQDVLDKIKIIKKNDGELVIYIGKYLWTKGIYLLLLAIPLILEKYPRSRFVFVGFGPFRELAELIINCLSKNRLDTLGYLIKTKFFSVDHHCAQPLPYLEESLNKHHTKIQKSLNLVNDKIIDSIMFTGIMDHKRLSILLPQCDVLVSPSVFPEAFGMVAIEALASGVYPVLTYQSAFKEIVEIIKTHLGNESPEVEKVYPNEDAFIKIYNNIDRFFQFRQELIKNNRLNQFKQKLRQITVKTYSWKAVASQYMNQYES
jgi:glycosyltransferase involved in cell wall biosynthesis